MAKYIEREPIIEEMQGLIDNVSYNYPYSTSIELEVIKGRYEAVIEYINEQPTADVQPTEYVNELIEQLKEAKRLLKLAVEDFSEMYDHIYVCDRLCETCILSGERDHCYKWRYADEVEKLLKEEINNDSIQM